MFVGTNILVEAKPKRSLQFCHKIKIMRYLLFFFLLSVFSCDQENDQKEFPRTFSFHHSTIIAEKGYVFGDNESKVEINSKAGNLDSLRFYVSNNFYQVIRSSTMGFYYESITLLSKDSVLIKAWQDNMFFTYTHPADLENINGEIIDKNEFGTTIIWDKNKQEIKFCIALALGIFELNGNPYFDVDYEICLAEDIQGELQNFISYNDYKKNDTLGLYMMEMAYKE